MPGFCIMVILFIYNCRKWLGNIFDVTWILFFGKGGNRKVYSPFIDSEGQLLGIEKVGFQHLEQTVDNDEGHHLEYKELLEDGGRAQLAKEIASFANCEGGWLIVGIDDKTKGIKPIDKTDYSQKVGKIATRISPLPEFETKFISLPNDGNKGVLLIYVYEGKYAPYICNGSVYVRSGSSKEPIKPAERGNIEYLLERSKFNKKRIEDFCKRDYFFGYTNRLLRKSTYPIANIYLKNISSKHTKNLNLYVEREKLIDFVGSKYGLFNSVQYSMDSIIFRNMVLLPSTNIMTLVLELFYDFSCKIYLPLGTPSQQDIAQIRNCFVDIGISNEVVNNFRILDGDTCTNALYGGLLCFDEIMKEYKLDCKEYAACFEVENAEEHILAFAGEEYYDFIHNNNIPFAQKEQNKSQIFKLADYPELDFKEVSRNIVSDMYSGVFGFTGSEFDRIWMGCNKKYN